jgi:hypothetical protein
MKNVSDKISKENQNTHFMYNNVFRKLYCLWELTNSMEQSPSWEANRSSAAQQIPRILWNPKVHYRV